MTNAQRLELRASEIRQRLNEIAGLEGDDFTDEIRAESEKLQTEYRDVETRRRAAIVAEGETVTETEKTETEDAEARERRELRSKASVGDFIKSVLTGRPVKGASAEYAEAEGCEGMMPLDLLDPAEERAVTPGPADETVTSTRPTVPFAFARTDAAALGISMPMVSPGEAHFPALTTAPPAGMKAEDGAADATAAAFSLTKRTPGRLTGQFVIRVEDIALLPSMERDLRNAISGQMANQLDIQVINGDGSAPNLSGLFHQATNVSAASDVETFGSGVSRFGALVDGKHAHGWGDVRALIGTDTFAKYVGTFANQGKGDVSLYDYLMGKLGGASGVHPRPRRGEQRRRRVSPILGAQGQPITVPVWKGVELIVDPYTQAGKGQRVITAVSLIGAPFIPYGAAQVKEFHPKIS